MSEHSQERTKKAVESAEKFPLEVRLIEKRMGSQYQWKPWSVQTEGQEEAFVPRSCLSKEAWDSSPASETVLEILVLRSSLPLNVSGAMLQASVALEDPKSEGQKGRGGFTCVRRGSCVREPAVS